MRLKPRALFLTLLVMGYAVGAFAAEVEAKADVKFISFSDILEGGGSIIWVLVGLSAIATFLVIFFLFTLRLEVLMPESFRVEAGEIAESGDVEALNVICRENDSPGAQIIGAATRVLTSNPNADYMIIRDVIEDEGVRQSMSLWQRTQYLQDISVIAPMIGLLGTVVGMIQAFMGLRSEMGVVKPMALASGVSQALITTAGGLIVSIFAMALFIYFRGRATKLVAQMEESCSMILQRFVFKTKRGDK